VSGQYYVPPENITAGGFFVSGGRARHIAGSMRLRKGDEITIFDGTGNQWRARLSAANAEEARGDIMEKLPPRSPSCRITVCFAPVSRQSTELMLDLCAQLGCSAFAPAITARTQFDITSRWAEKSVRWREVLIQSCCQCGVPQIPELLAPRPFSAAVKDFAGGVAAIASPGAGLSLAEFCRSRAPLSEIAVFIGPEGDFTPQELELARSAGITPAGLGPYIMRAETACAAACAQILQ